MNWGELALGIPFFVIGVAIVTFGAMMRGLQRFVRGFFR